MHFEMPAILRNVNITTDIAKAQFKNKKIENSKNQLSPAPCGFWWRRPAAIGWLKLRGVVGDGPSHLS